MSGTSIDWQKVANLTNWTGRPFEFDILINNELENIKVFKKRLTNIVFADTKSISINLNSRNPFIKFDRAAYIDDDGWLWVGNSYAS